MYVLQNNQGIQSETNTHGLFQIQSGNTFSELEILFEKKKWAVERHLVQGLIKGRDSKSRCKI